MFDLLSNWLSHVYFVSCVMFISFARNAPRNIKGLAASTGKIFFKLLTNYCVYARSEVRNQLIFSGRQNTCNLLLYLTTKHVFENFGKGNCRVALIY